MEKLEIYKNDSFVLNDSFDQAVMNLHILKKQNGYKSFVICGCEAGDGNTTVAINLAAALASSGWNTVLIDGDMRKKNKIPYKNKAYVFFVRLVYNNIPQSTSATTGLLDPESTTALKPMTMNNALNHNLLFFTPSK